MELVVIIALVAIVLSLMFRVAVLMIAVAIAAAIVGALPWWAVVLVLLAVFLLPDRRIE